MTIGDIRNQFPTLNRKIGKKRLIYFDNACSVLKPKPVIEAILNYYQNFGCCGGGRSSHLLSHKVDELCEKSREVVKSFIGAGSSEEIIFTRNTTEGINLVAKSFPFERSKNEVIVTNLEHHSNLLPFFEEEKRGRVKIKILKVNSDGSIDFNKLEKIISSKTALISITHASNVLGNVLPISEIAKIAHKKNAFILVDDAQYVSIHKEDVELRGIDFLVFSGHKIGGPTGIGVLYGRKELLEKFSPFNVGGGMVEKVWINNNQLRAKYLSLPRRFEAGVQDYAGIIGLSAATDFIIKIGHEEIFRQVSILYSYLVSGLQKISQIEILGGCDSGRTSSIVSFRFKIKKYFPHDFNLYLNYELKKNIIAIRCGHHCAMPIHQHLNAPLSVRLSFFVYNTKKEVDVFLEALNTFLIRKA